MYYVYAIYNREQDRIYVGQTSNLDQRLRLHNNQSFSGSYTADLGGEWRLIYKEAAPDRSLALGREKQLKSYRGRQFIRSLIQGP